MRRKIAFIVSCFPKNSEPFVLDEILDLQRRGLEIEVFSLLREKKSSVHREIRKLKGEVHYAGIGTRAFWSAQFYWLSHHPSVYIRTWWKAVSGNVSSLAFLASALLIVPVAAYFALLLKERKIEHVHAHSATHSALAAYVIRLLTGISYSITAHSHDIYANHSMLKEKLSEADFIVALSQYNSRILGRLGSEIGNKIHLIPYGVDPERFREPSRIREQGNPFTILCVATLRGHKGHRHLVEACASLKEHGVQFRCLFAGDGPERRRLEMQIGRLGLEEQIRLLSWQDRQEIHDLMREADVFALPSFASQDGKEEEIPLALMEAMAMEIPVVATSIYGVSELVEHGKTGLLVPEKNCAALAAAMYLIYSQRESAQEMARAGKSRVLNEFNLHLNSGRFYRILSGIAQPRAAESYEADPEFWQMEGWRAC